jgi:hypothetical protein
LQIAPSFRSLKGSSDMDKSNPRIVQISAASAVVDGDVVTTVVALLENGSVIYTGANAPNNEWHELNPPKFRPGGKLAL